MKDRMKLIELLQEEPRLYRQPGEVGLLIARVEGVRLDAIVWLIDRNRKL